MDFESFKLQFESSRRVDVPVGSATFKMVVPLEHAWRIAIEAHRDAEGRFLQSAAFRAILNVALVGWEGVRTTDFMPDSADEPLPFSEQARAYLLDCRQDIADELTVALGQKLRERREQREAARKN